MAIRQRMVVCVDDIMEGMRDVAFEGKVLNRYGNFDSNKVMEHKYLHCDLIDRNGFTTVTISIHQDQVRENEGKLRVGNVIRVENFGVSKKTKKGHEKGDLHYVLKVLSTSIVTIIEANPGSFIPEFYHTDSVNEFRKRSHEAWASASIAVCVIDIRGSFGGKYGTLYQIVVADGCTENDYDVLAFSDQFKAEYEQVVEAYNSGLCVMVLFKNISTTQTGDRYFITRNHTIITPVVDEFVRLQLQGVYEKMGKKTMTSCKEVQGTLSIERPSIAPFKHTCVKWKYSNLMVIEGGFYCNICHSLQSVAKKSFLQAKVTNAEGEVSIFLEGQWLEALVRMGEDQFLGLARGQQIKMLSTLRVKGTFSLTPMSYLCGFEENMEMTSDSNIQITNISQSDGVVTPLKRKFDEVEVDASPGAVSTSKPK